MREVRVEHRAAQAALVAQHEPTAVLELEREAVPEHRRAVVRRRVAGGRVVDDDPAGHPQVEPERRPAVGGGQLPGVAGDAVLGRAHHEVADGHTPLRSAATRA